MLGLHPTAKLLSDAAVVVDEGAEPEVDILDSMADDIVGHLRLEGVNPSAVNARIVWENTRRPHQFDPNDFHTTSCSPNGKFVVGYDYSDRCIVLGRKKRTLYRVDAEDPQNIIVDDAGSVYFADNSKPLLSEFFSIGRDGARRWNAIIRASILKFSLSDDQQHVIVETCSSDDEDLVLDSLLGTMVDDTSYAEAKWEERRRMSYWESLESIASAISDGSDDAISHAKTLVEEWCQKDEQLPDKHRARLWRYRGELAEKEGQHDLVIEYWEHALSIDSKVGIARRLALKKSL